MNLFGKRLREVRNLRGLKQVELAKKLGVTRSVISRYELGINDPPSENISKLAEILGVSSDYLLGRTDDPGIDNNNKREPDLNAPLYESNLGDALLKVAEMVYEYNLPPEVRSVLFEKVVQKFKPSEKGNLAAHGPRQPGSGAFKKEDENDGDGEEGGS